MTDTQLDCCVELDCTAQLRCSIRNRTEFLIISLHVSRSHFR